MKTDPRYATNAARMQHNDEVQQIVRDWVASMPRAQVLQILEDYEVVGSAVNDSSDIADDPHFNLRTLQDLTSDAFTGKVPGPVLHMSGSDNPAYDFVPQVGEHSHEVLTTVAGLTADEYDQLAAAGVVPAA